MLHILYPPSTSTTPSKSPDTINIQCSHYSICSTLYSPWCPIWAATPLPTTQSSGDDDDGDYDSVVNSGDACVGGDDTDDVD